MALQAESKAKYLLSLEISLPLGPPESLPELDNQAIPFSFSEPLSWEAIENPWQE